MQRPGFIPELIRSLDRKPTVGGLVALSEENYQFLRQLIRPMEKIDGQHCSCLDNHMDLYLEVVERTPYTTTLHLTYYFYHHQGQTPDPDVLLRIYHDSRQVEVLSLSQQCLPLPPLFEAPGLLNKWRANLFLSKWLAFCIRQGHRFQQNTGSKTEQTMPVVVK